MRCTGRGGGCRRSGHPGAGRTGPCIGAVAGRGASYGSRGAAAGGGGGGGASVGRAPSAAVTSSFLLSICFCWYWHDDCLGVVMNLEGG